MTSWLFGIDEEGWTLPVPEGYVWIGTEGRTLGCLYGDTVNSHDDAPSITGLSIAATLDDPFSAWVRVTSPSGGGAIGDDVTITLAINGSGLGFADITFTPGADPDYDSGWQLISGTITSTDTVTSVSFQLSGGPSVPSFDLYLDDVYLLESPPAVNELRFLGLDANAARLYVTAIFETTLQLRAYTLETLLLANTASFGTVDYADPDTLTRGLKPKVVSDQVVYAYGRSGDDAQVLVSEDAGDTFADVSDAGWASDKFCVALLPDPLLPADLVAAFADNDLYRSEDGAASWSKSGDSPVTLRAAARHTSAPAELLLAAQAADSLRFTNNYGVSFEDVSETVGTVNVIVVSR